MQECVDAFRESRSGVLEFARRGGDGAREAIDGTRDAVIEGPVSKKRKVDTAEARNERTPVDEGIGRRTRSQNRRTDNNATPVQTVVVDDIEDSNDGDYQPGMVLFHEFFALDCRSC